MIEGALHYMVTEAACYILRSILINVSTFMNILLRNSFIDVIHDQNRLKVS